MSPRHNLKLTAVIAAGDSMITNAKTGASARERWILVLRGALSLAMGIFIITRPLESVAVFALVVAFWALIDGIVHIAHSFDLRGVVEHWWVMLVNGVLGVIIGVAALYFYPVLSLVYVVIWVGLWLLFAGATAVYLAVQETRQQASWGWTLIFGCLALGAGILAFVFPQLTLGALMIVMSVYGIIGGIILLGRAGTMRSRTA
jgi:uncharacterized membrane protein HdeD (DUF308 family)